MKGIEIRVHYVLMAAPALVDDFLAKVTLVDPLDGVGLMAVIAAWKLLFRFICGRTVDTALELFIDAQMTGATS